MNWVQACKLYSEKNGGKYIVPKKGTKEYDEVKKLMGKGLAGGKMKKPKTKAQPKFKVGKSLREIKKQPIKNKLIKKKEPQEQPMMEPQTEPQIDMVEEVLGQGLAGGALKKRTKHQQISVIGDISGGSLKKELQAHQGYVAPSIVRGGLLGSAKNGRIAGTDQRLYGKQLHY